MIYPVTSLYVCVCVWTVPTQSLRKAERTGVESTTYQSHFQHQHTTQIIDTLVVVCIVNDCSASFAVKYTFSSWSSFVCFNTSVFTLGCWRWGCVNDFLFTASYFRQIPLSVLAYTLLPIWCRSSLTLYVHISFLLHGFYFWCLIPTLSVLLPVIWSYPFDMSEPVQSASYCVLLL